MITNVISRRNIIDSLRRRSMALTECLTPETKKGAPIQLDDHSGRGAIASLPEINQLSGPLQLKKRIAPEMRKASEKWRVQHEEPQDDALSSNETREHGLIFQRNSITQDSTVAPKTQVKRNGSVTWPREIERDVFLSYAGCLSLLELRWKSHQLKPKPRSLSDTQCPPSPRTIWSISSISKSLPA